MDTRLPRFSPPPAAAHAAGESAEHAVARQMPTRPAPAASGASRPVRRAEYLSAPRIRKENVTAASISRLEPFKNSPDAQIQWLAKAVEDAIEGQSLHERDKGCATYAIYGRQLTKVQNQQGRFALVATFDKRADGKLELATAILRDQLTQEKFGFDTRRALPPTERQAAGEQSVPAGSSADPRVPTPEPAAAATPTKSADSLFGSSPMEDGTPSPAPAVPSHRPLQLAFPAPPAESDGGISPGGDVDAASTNGSDWEGELDRDLQAAFENLSSSSPATGADSPAAPASPGTGPSGAGSKRHGSPSAAESQPKRVATPAGTTMQPPSRIPGSASAPFDLTRGDTPAPSAASAAGTQAQQIKRTPVATEHKATFDKAYKACVKELFKYFSDAELAELSRDTAPEKASHRALLCRAMPADKNALDATLDTWIAQSQEAIPDLKDDDPLLFAANGKPHGAAMLAYHRSTVGGAREPLPVRAPLNEKAYENNFAALERFRESFCQSLELDKDARRSDILLEHGAAKRNKWSKPSGPCIWATDEGIDLTQHDEDTLDYLRRTFVNASAGNSQRTRLAEAKPFFEFLAKEYRQRQAEEES